MKKIIYFTLIFFIGMGATWAQDSQYAKDIIASKDVTINSIPVLQLDTISLIQYFGKPLSVNPHLNELENIHGYHYNYNGVKFTVENGRIQRFVVTGRQYGITPYKIKVGDNINLLKSYFPLSFTNMKNDENGYVIGVNIKDEDSFLYIQTDPNYIITKISVISY